MRASRSATSWVWSVPVNALEKVGCRGEVSEEGVGGYTPTRGGGAGDRKGESERRAGEANSAGADDFNQRERRLASRGARRPEVARGRREEVGGER